MSVLCYLDDAGTDDGCLWVIPRNHRHGTISGLEDRGVLGALYTAVGQVPGEAVPAARPAGSVIWLDRDLVHGSQSSCSQRDRRVLVLAYQPAGLRRGRIDRVRPVGAAGRAR